MKSLFFLLVFWTIALSSCSKGDPGTSPEKTGPSFPDANFRAALVESGFVETDGDIDPSNVVNQQLFASMSRLAVNYKEIVSLQGIGCFTALTELQCRNNLLKTLDLSKNTMLSKLDCSGNQLPVLKLSDNTALTSLYCHNNMLTALDLSKNTLLRELGCSDNGLDALCVSENTTLFKLNCANNRLTALDISGNKGLFYLYCNDNQIAELDTSDNSELIDLYCHNNLLTELTTSETPKLKELKCHNNQLSTLDISSLTDLNCSSFYCGTQRQDTELNLRLTQDQSAVWKFYKKKDAPENAHVTEILAD